METTGKRPGETALDFDPAERTERGVVFIGHVRSPWKRGDCPKNLRQARERGGGATLIVSEAYRPGLTHLQNGQPIIVLYWMDGSARDLIVQRPKHTDGPRGVFALRSPARPNPIAMAAVRITSIDHVAGEIGIDAIDCFDGTPLIDIKPWLETIDLPPPA